MSRRLFASILAPACALLALAAPAPAAADGILNDPLARFDAPLCPGVVGLTVEAGEQVVGRIRTNAEEFGLELADPATCEPNIIVAVLADGRDYLARLAEARPYLFSSLDAAERRDLLASEGPARVWLTTQLRTRDGIRVGERENLVELPQATMWSAHSRIYRPVRRDITSAMVLVDRDAVSALTLAQLADYATLRSLSARFPEEADGEGASLLTLFDTSEEAPAGLTPLDRAFLARLYESIPNLPASMRLKGLPTKD